jgi:hypothetical protein
MINNDWQCYDMINVTFVPKKMTPWELQEEFLRSIKSFYDFSGAIKIWKIFGYNYGLRRLGFAMVVSAGVGGMHLLSKINNGNPYYMLRHYKEEPTEQRRPHRKQLRKTA